MSIEIRAARSAVLPLSYAVMSTLTADQATFILNVTAMPRLNMEHPVTKRVIAAIPPDKVDYRPDAIVKSAIDLAWHIVTAEIRFLDATITGVFDLNPVPRPDSMRKPEAVNRWYT